MARYPQPGHVKTRLARSLGARLAADLYRAFLLDIDARFRNGPRVLVWMYEPPDAPFTSLLPEGGLCLPQSGQGLGERMRRSFETLLGATGASDEIGVDRVIMIGSDIPHIGEASIAEADERLDDHDAVIGPSDDGGYYLIGLRRPIDLFSGIEMGTPRVLEDTLSTAREVGARVHLLPHDFDVDERADLERLRGLIERGGCQRLPHTEDVMNRCLERRGER